ncbi:hypothetical protein BGW38_001199 [Lunasporangiospora selenospora]|uniref:J domain-containing protein n=1 Tax=Lunasporangiospora selenospora TaxID=979761 RepID=A0A9P6FUJ2_9FUNG|nr:hypothetical protein BGW38_001199 [Lunasporangiospora selenospora]
MDRNTVRLYTVLGVPKTSSQDEIKKAYRRLALRYHPDRVNVAEVPDHENRFREIAAAYEILGDPEKRRFYDRLGMMGVKMSDSDLGAQILEFESMIMWSFLFFSAAIILLIVFLSFLVMRVDGKVDWNYNIVFTPLWTLDGLVLITVSWAIVSLCAKADTVDDNNGDIDDTEEDREIRERQRRDQATGKRMMRVVQIAVLCAVLLFMVPITVFETFIAKKLNDPTSLTALKVFIPYLVLESCILFISYIIALVTLMKSEATSPLAKLAIIFAGTWSSKIRMAQAVLIMLRVDDKITWSWFVVFTPLYLVGLKYFIELIAGFIASSRIEAENNEEAATESNSPHVRAVSPTIRRITENAETSSISSTSSTRQLIPSAQPQS